MSIPVIQTSFSSGEIAPALFGNVALARFHSAGATIRNMFVGVRGGVYSRPGTAFVGYSKQTGRAYPPKLITFQFSINQGLALEFGNNYMRVVENGGFVLETAVSITGATNASACVVSAVNSFANGDWVVVQGVQGMTQLNGRAFVLTAVSGSSFALQDVFGNSINSTTYGTYTSGGTAARVFTLPTPYAEADLEWLKFTQSADVMSIGCWNQETGTTYPPYDLKRLGSTNWTIAQVSFVQTINPPDLPPGLGVTPPPASGTYGIATYSYVVTAVNPVDGTESIATKPGTVVAVDIATTAGSINLRWDAVAGASSYNVYKATPTAALSGSAPPGGFVGTWPASPAVGALFGYAGTSYGTVMTDSNIVPDFSTVPPLHTNPFAPGAILFASLTATGAGYVDDDYANNNGYGYVTVTVATATGSGADLRAVLDPYGGGAVIAIVIYDAGKNYLLGDTITISQTPPVGPPNTSATGTITIGPQTGIYPSVPTYFQQRRVYASSPNNPDTYWMSQPGSFTNFDRRIPTIATDAITGTPWGVQVDGIQFMVPMPGGLVVLTGSSAWQVSGVGTTGVSNIQPITPGSQQATPQAFNGIHSNVPPIRINYDILYVQAKGSIVRDLSYNFWVNIYTGTDLTIFSSHLFTGYSIEEWAWCEEPFKLVWAVRSGGPLQTQGQGRRILLSLTFLKEQEITAWAHHDTDGDFESLCSVTEPPVDALYLAVRRQPGQVSAYFIERMDNRLWSAAENCWCVDAGLSLPQPTPNATLAASSSTGLGAISGVTGLVGGINYSAGTTLAVSDPTGSGAVLTPTIVGGVVTAITVSVAGTSYTNPVLTITDPTGLGTGASAALTLSNTATFWTNVPIFSSGSFPAGSVGQVLRMGGGIATITAYIDSEHVTANITQPIIDVIPNTADSNGLNATPEQQPPGAWTMASPVTAIGGLWHLIGTYVTGLADGAVIGLNNTPLGKLVASDGTIALDNPATQVIVGLPFQVQFQSVYLEEGSPTMQGRRKHIPAVTARVEASRGFKIGSNQTDASTLSPSPVSVNWPNMIPAPPIGPLPSGQARRPLYTGDIRIPLGGGYQKPGQVALQQDTPLPLNLLALIPEVDPGDLPTGPLQPQPPTNGGSGGGAAAGGRPGNNAGLPSNEEMAAYYGRLR